MMQWIKKLLGIRCPEQITEELIKRLPADKLCQKYIDGELASDMESEVFDSIMCAVELDAEVHQRRFQPILLQFRWRTCAKSRGHLCQARSR